MPQWNRTRAADSSRPPLILYGERGFDNTTVAEIADCAGLTKRTFFRYFADKARGAVLGLGGA